MNIIKIIVISLGAVFVLVTLKQEKNNFSFFATILFSIALTRLALMRTDGQFTFLSDTLNATLQSSHVNILLKALGISLMTETASDFCKEAGENSISSKIELIGKAELLILSIPLIENILKIVNNI